MPERLESCCYHGTLHKCPAAGASLASGYSVLGNIRILEAKDTDFFSRYVFNFPKAIKKSLNFRPVYKALHGLEVSRQSDCVRDQIPLSSGGIDKKGEMGLVRGYWPWARADGLDGECVYPCFLEINASGFFREHPFESADACGCRYGHGGR